MNQESSQLENKELKTFLDDTFDTMEKVLDEQNPELRQYEIGTVQFCRTRYCQSRRPAAYPRGGTGSLCGKLYGAGF